MKTLQYKNKEGQWISIPVIGSLLTQEDLANFIDSVKYNEETQEIEFYHGESIIDTLDVTPFLVDNFVKEVEIIGTDLVITFNTEDKPAIRVPLEKIFNPDNYYTKNKVEERLDEELYEEVLDTNGYDYIDMGAAGIWATCNVGASKPEEYGKYFALGETRGYLNSQIPTEKKFNWDDYKFEGDDDGGQTKYNTEDRLTVLEPEDDAVCVNMGGNWRMPTQEEFEKLKNLCNSEWTSNYNGTGVSGVIFKLKTDNSKQLFFPSAGMYNGFNNNDEIGTYGSIWSSSIYLDRTSFGYCLYIDGNFISNVQREPRNVGQSVRGILGTVTKIKSPKYLTKQKADETYAKKEWTGTQEEYDAIEPKDSNITYYIIEE